jgi:transcriptional regulator with XRE-family HTH domain
VAREIRRRREAAGLSQKELARRAGFSREYVSRAERSSSGLPSENLVAILDAALDAGGALLQLDAAASGARRERRQDLASGYECRIVGAEQGRRWVWASGCSTHCYPQKTLTPTPTTSITALRTASVDHRDTPCASSRIPHSAGADRRVHSAAADDRSG